MAKIYLVRHAESVANTEGIYQGQTYNTGLSLRGKNQAKKLITFFDDLKLDRIIVSPLKRTRQTATFVADSHAIKLLTEKRIIETNHGQWEGKHKDFISKNWPKIYANWIGKPKDVAFPGGEKFTDTKARTLVWWNKVKKLEGDTLVVTHDNIIRIILAEASSLDLNSIWEFNLLPTGVSTLIIKDGNVNVIEINNTRHLIGDDLDITNHAL